MTGGYFDWIGQPFWCLLVDEVIQPDLNDWKKREKKDY